MWNGRGKSKAWSFVIIAFYIGFNAFYRMKRHQLKRLAELARYFSVAGVFGEGRRVVVFKLNEVKNTNLGNGLR